MVKAPQRNCTRRFEVVVITLHENGARLFVNSSYSKIIKPKEEDLKGLDVGAGDFFSAAFICKHLQGSSLEEVCTMQFNQSYKTLLEHERIVNRRNSFIIGKVH